ncbi:MAG: hypothetical protein U9N49_04800, partial [Campylobacterota bacterium]|nr:hypothetical protein [Campylobacterota bacterium]
IQVDEEMKIISYSYGVEKYFPDVEQMSHVVGSDILDYLPELVGSEKEIKKLFWVYNSSFDLDTVNRNGNYIDISIQYCGTKSLLITIQDNTTIIQAQQKLLQSNNELLLLQRALQQVFDQQNALMFVVDNYTLKFANQKLIDYFNKDNLEEIKKMNLELYKNYDEDFESYEDLLLTLLDKVGYITIEDDDFVIQVSKLDITHKLITLTRIQN